MHKTSFCVFVLTFFTSVAVQAQYNGPFVLWGLSGLNGIKNSALNTLDDKLLRDFYAKASSIIVFLKNSTTKLDETNFPSFKTMIQENEYIYLTQDTLTSDPLDYNANAEVINLVGDGQQQDVELTALYRDALLNYGEGNVLGILASRYDMGMDRHTRSRRAAEEPTATVNDDDPTENNYIYLAKNRGLIWTAGPPVLRVDAKTTYNLTNHTVATTDERKDENRFKIQVVFALENKQKATLKFQFVRSLGLWWTMKSIDVEYNENGIKKMYNLQIVGKEPSAPMNYSYHCPNELLFRGRNHSVNLTMTGIQVQPYYTNDKFGIAYDCVTFFTVPIWSGIFVTFLMLLVLTIALTAIAEIKPPNRFESKSGAQLTFTVQE